MIASRPWSRVDVRVYHRTRVHHGYLQTHDVLGWVLHAELTREQRRQQGVTYGLNFPQYGKRNISSPDLSENIKCMVSTPGLIAC